MRPSDFVAAARQRKKGGADGSSDQRRYRGFYKSFVRASVFKSCGSFWFLWMFSYTAAAVEREASSGAGLRASARAFNVQLLQIDPCFPVIKVIDTL